MGRLCTGLLWHGFLSTPSVRRATAPVAAADTDREISIHALREEGDRRISLPRDLLEISIHALREEGDLRLSVTRWNVLFLSTPSVRRATANVTVK